MTRRTALFMALVLSATAAPAVGQRRWTDEKHGYSVLTLKDWEQVPVEPTERYAVARWAPPRDIRRFPCRMHVYVFERERKQKDQKERAVGVYDLGDRFGPKHSFKAWARYQRGRQDMDLGDGTRFRIEAPEGVEVDARVYEGTRDSGYSIGGRPLGDYYWMAATYTTETHEYAVELYCGEVSKRRFRPWFKKVVTSFELLERGEEEAGNGEKEQLSPREEARKRAEENTRVPGWWYEESEHYIIVTNLDRRHRDKIITIRRQLEAMRKLYERDFPPPEPIEAISIVRICKDRQTYLNYGGSPSTAGYWNFVAKELVLYLKGYFRYVLGVLNHEAFHQYIFYACGQLHPHTWFNEGYGEYYFGTEVVGRRGIINVCRPRVDVIKGHIRAGTHVPMEEFIRYSKAQYYSDANRCYAQGWALVYFLKEGISERHPWSGILETYFQEIVKTRSAEKALETAFDGVDLQEFERAWAAFVVGGKKVR